MAPQDPHGGGYGTDGYNSDGFNRQGEYDATYDQDSAYYIERGDTADTSEQIERAAERTADAQEAGGGWLDDIIDRFTREGRVDQAYDQQLTGQAAGLAHGVETRQPPIMMCSNYMSVAHPELRRMVTEDVDSGQVREMGDMWIEAGNAMTNFQTGVATAINNSETDWQGQAGNSARQFMAEVGNWVGSAGQSAQLAGTQTNIQADALDEAKRAMPEPVEFDAAATNRDLQSTSNPIELINKYNDYMEQYEAQQEAHQRAAQVVGTYDSGLGGASVMPAFQPPPVMANPGAGTSDVGSGQIDTLGRDPSAAPSGPGGTGSGGSGGSGGAGGNPFVPTPPPSGPDGSGSGGGSGGSGGSGGGSGGFGGNPTVPTPGGSGGTNPSGGGPDLPGPVAFPPPSSPTPGPGSGSGNPNVPGAPMPVGMGPGMAGGDAERRGFGGGRFGGGPGGGFGGGGAGGGAGAGGMGGRGGMGGMGSGAGAMAADSAAARGGAVGGGVAGRGGVGGGMMGAGGARGQGDDDDEHQRPSFLVEGDPDAVFGTDEATAPPVIGQ